MLDSVNSKIKELKLEEKSTGKKIIAIDYVPGGDMTKNWIAFLCDDPDKIARGKNGDEAALTLIGKPLDDQYKIVLI